MSLHAGFTGHAIQNCPLNKKIEVFIENHDKTKLEGILGVGSHDPSAPILLLLHPQPNSNGDMWNEVLQNVMDFSMSMGFIVLTVNFSGVGRSGGTCDQNGHTAFQDAAVAFKWLYAQRPYSKSRWVFGFSFGAYVAAQLTMRRPEVDHFIYISMPVGIYDLSFFSPCPVGGLIIQAIDDKIVQESNLVDFMIKNDKAKHVAYVRVGNNVNHFFRKVDYKTAVFPYIYKFAKENCNWPNFLPNSTYDSNLSVIKFHKYKDFSELMQTLPSPTVQEQFLQQSEEIFEDAAFEEVA